MKAEKIIDSLKFTSTDADEQKDIFTPSHTLFKCVIVTPARRRFTFPYQCNAEHQQTTAKDCLSCLLSDASSVDYCTDEADFLQKFGYIDTDESIRRGLKAFKACQHTAKSLERLFSSEELGSMREFYENY